MSKTQHSSTHQELAPTSSTRHEPAQPISTHCEYGQPTSAFSDPAAPPMTNHGSERDARQARASKHDPALPQNDFSGHQGHQCVLVGYPYWP